LHGANRIGALDPETLPKDDAHHAGDDLADKLRDALHASEPFGDVEQPSLFNLEAHEI
jgi:hypothetical protein